MLFADGRWLKNYPVSFPNLGLQYGQNLKDENTLWPLRKTLTSDKILGIFIIEIRNTKTKGLTMYDVDDLLADMEAEEQLKEKLDLKKQGVNLDAEMSSKPAKNPR
jgi:hypothetical protein